MKIAVVSFTRNGCALNRRLCRKLSAHETEGFALTRYAKESLLAPVSPTLSAWTGRMFREKDALIFLGAAGIAVRSIAPYVKSKKTDPAVIVADEQGTFAISLLSGHIGGANELTREVAAILGATPVITTATDVGGRFAADVFAVKNHCHICEMELAKEVSAAIVDGRKVGFYSDFPVDGERPAELEKPGDGPLPELGICLSLSAENAPFSRTLHLIPRIVTVGIGCRRGTPEEKLREAFLCAARRAGISPEAVCQAASIDLKAEEQGILALARQYGWNYRTYTAEELMAVPGTFTASSFVKEITGVDNVCERSAVLAGGTLIWKKEAADGVTIAFAAGNWRAEF